MAAVLTTTGPTRPGIYIGKIYSNVAGGITGFRRIPMLVGKGSRLKIVANAPIRRSFITGYQLSFTTSSPYTALLAYDAVNNQANFAGDTQPIRLYRSNGTPVPVTKWRFTESTPGSGQYDTVLILPDAYEPQTTYFIDYQSNDRTILDPLPFGDLRQMGAVGDYENQSSYNEGENYFVPVDITDPEADAGNANSAPTDHAFTAVTAVPGNVGTAIVTINAGQAPLNHNYNRNYTLEVLTVVGPVVTVELSVTQGSGGLESRAQVPLHASLPAPLYPATMIDTATTLSLTTLTFTDPEIGESIDIDWQLTALVSVPGDRYTFSTLGQSLIEVDSAITNTNQWSQISAVTPDAGNTGTGVVAIRPDALYTGTSNRSYRLVCTAAAGVGPNRTATFLWAAWGELPYSEGTFSISETTGTNSLVALNLGIRLALTFGGTHFAVGDVFDFSALCARKVITAKDSRNYTFTVGTTGAGVVQAQYVTDTTEGWFDQVVVAGPVGQMKLPGDIDLWLRNIGTTAPQNRFVSGDIWTWTTTDEEVMDWSLTSRTTETIPVANVSVDGLGVTTGTPGAYFVILANQPTSVLYVRDSVTGSLITGWSLITGRPVIQLPSLPVNPIEVHYEYVGAEPAPGDLYYVSALILRPITDYNRAIIYYNYDEAAAPALGPSATDNDLMIGAELVLKDNGAAGVYVVQVYDSNQDGVFTVQDYNTALDKVMSVDNNTDLIVLGQFASLQKQLTENITANNPFKGHVNLALWVGMPLGSVVGGDSNTPGSIVNTATNALQLPFESQARGTRCLVANYEAIKTIQLADGSQVDVTLDGSFIAAALAGLNASFENPNTLLLDTQLSGFKYIKTFEDEEELQLITASAIYVWNDGSETVPIYKIGEGVTVDTSDDSLHEVNVAINVRTYTQADMRAHLRRTVIGIIPSSPEAGIADYRTQIALRMGFWRTQEIIGEWLDGDGNGRTLDPNTDIRVYWNRAKKTQYQFAYAWYGRYGSTRGLGLYVVDSSDFGQPS